MSNVEQALVIWTLCMTAVMLWLNVLNVLAKDQRRKDAERNEEFRKLMREYEEYMNRTRKEE